MPRNWTHAGLATEYNNDEDLPAVEVVTDGCDCCTTREKRTTVKGALLALDETIENLRIRLAAIESLRHTIVATGTIPKETP